MISRRSALAIRRIRPMKPRCIALAGFVGVTTGFIAFAASADGYSGPPGAYIEKPYIGWTGFYIGGHVGGAWSTVDWGNVNLTGERVNRGMSERFSEGRRPSSRG